MNGITFVSSTLGGVLIGLSAVFLMFSAGRIAGISGIVARLLPPYASDGQLFARLAFVSGLIAGPLLMQAIAPVFGFDLRVPAASPAIPLMLVVAGVLVGFGSVLGSGCTSGHGVCGLARFSVRSMAATAIFLGAAVVTVYAVRHVFGS